MFLNVEPLVELSGTEVLQVVQPVVQPHPGSEGDTGTGSSDSGSSEQQGPLPAPHRHVDGIPAGAEEVDSIDEWIAIYEELEDDDDDGDGRGSKTYRHLGWE